MMANLLIILNITLNENYLNKINKTILNKYSKEIQRLNAFVSFPRNSYPVSQKV